MKHTERIRKYLPPGILVLSVLVFFHEILVTGKPLHGSDFVLAFHPWKQFLYNHVQIDGTLPLWNPHVLSGTPFLADIQTALFYPFGFLFYLLPSRFAYGYTVILHWILGVLFMYRFTRTLSMGRSGAFIASLIFAYNGYVVGHLYAGHLTFIQNYFWIPVVFLFSYKFLRTGNIIYALWAGLFLGVQILGGFPQIAFYTILATLLFYLYTFFTRLDQGDSVGPSRTVLGAGIVIVLGFALAAVQLLPTYEFTQLSSRSGGVSYAFATMDSLPPMHLITFLLPNLFGNPANATYWKSPEVWQFWELCGYVGVGPILVCIFLTGVRSSRPVIRFFLFLWVGALFLSLGRYNPLYRYIYHLPGFHHFRIPAQILYLHVFAVSVLAGAAIDRLERRCLSSPFLLPLSGAIIFLLAATALGYQLAPDRFFQFTVTFLGLETPNHQLWGTIQQTILLSLFTAMGLVFLYAVLLYLRGKQMLGSISFTILFSLVTVGDLWSFSFPLIKTTTLEVPVRQEVLVPSAQSGQGLFRIVTMGRTLRPNTCILLGYEDIHGYNPMILKRYLEYLNKSQKKPWAPEAVNVRYVSQLENDMVGLLNVRYAALDDNKIYRLKKYYPRAFIVHKAVRLPKNEVLDFLARPGFDPLAMVILEKAGKNGEGGENRDSPGNATMERGVTTAPPLAGERCHIVRFTPNGIDLQVTLKEDGYLVLSEIAYPGWKARVDGREVKIHTGNYLFRTVPVPAGAHSVTFRFESRSLRIGAVITLVALLLFLVMQGIALLGRGPWKRS